MLRARALRTAGAFLLRLAPDEMRGLTVLELGAGAGLAGLVAATHPPVRATILTDGVPATLRNLRANAARAAEEGSFGGSAVDVRRLDWNESVESAPSADLLLAADVV